MKIIGIDTATTAASVALVDNGIVIAEKSHPSRAAGYGYPSPVKTNHAETILPLLESLLENTGMSFQDIDGLAIAIGPGSFTGLRIGLSTVKGLAYGSRLSVVGVSTLLALAARATDYDGLICPLLDARKNEVYAGLFEKTGDSVRRLCEDTAASVTAILEIIERLASGKACLMVGDGAVAYKQRLLDRFGDRVLFTGDISLSTAGAVARLSEHRFHSNDFDNLGSLTPVYLRRSQNEFNPSSFV